MDTFGLRIIASDKVFFNGRCKKLTIPAPDGEKGVLAHHENMVIDLLLTTPYPFFTTALFSALAFTSTIFAPLLSEVSSLNRSSVSFSSSPTVTFLFSYLS